MNRFNNMVGTRVYNIAAASRTAFTATSSAAVGIGPLNGLREVMFTANKRCFVLLGASDVAAADQTLATVLPVEAGEKFHLRLPNGITHYRVVSDGEDGIFRAYPVA